MRMKILQINQAAQLVFDWHCYLTTGTDGIYLLCATFPVKLEIQFKYQTKDIVSKIPVSVSLLYMFYVDF